MAYPDYFYNQCSFKNLVNNTVVSDTNTEGMLSTLKFAKTGRERVLCQVFDGLNNAGNSTGINTFYFFKG